MEGSRDLFDTCCQPTLMPDDSGKLNALVANEIGVDDGGYLPLSGLGGWNLQVAIE